MPWLPTALGQLPGDNSSAPLAMSTDGTVVFGYSVDSPTGKRKAVRWEGGFVTQLDIVGAGDNEVQACVPDGSKAGGSSFPGATFWSGTAATDLGLPAAFASGAPLDCKNNAIFDDGWLGSGIKIVTVFDRLGIASDVPRSRGILWASGPVELPPISGVAADTSFAVAIAHTHGLQRSVGWSTGSGPSFTATIWEVAGAVNLGYLTGGTTSQAFAIDADASVIVGSSDLSGGQTHGVSWNSSYVATDLGTLPGGDYSAAHYVTQDGATIIGNAHDAAGNIRAVYWQSGTIHELPPLTGGTSSNDAWLSGETRPICSADGSVVIGSADDGTNNYSVVWQHGFPDKLLPFTGLDPGTTSPLLVSADGTKIYGTAQTADGFVVAVVWAPAAPFGLSCGPSSSTSITAQWTAFDGATSYIVQYRALGTSTWTQINGITATSVVISGLVGSTEYEWRVKPDNGDFSVIATCTTESFTFQFLTCQNGFTVTQPTTKLWGFDHLIGMQVTGLLDGVPMPPVTVASDGSVTLPFAASNIKIGLAFTPQLQTPYLDAGTPTVQGRRKDIAAVTVRVDRSAGPEVGTNQPDGAAQTPIAIAPPWSNMTADNPWSVQKQTYLSPAGQTVTKLFTGDLRVPVTADWQTPGQVAVQQTQPLPLQVTAVIPELLEGDTIEQSYSQQQGAAPRGQPQQPRGPGMWMLKG